MARFTPQKSNFSGGQISPLLQNASDTEPFQNGAEQLLNTIVLTERVAANRPGSHYVSSVKTSSKKVRLIPFVFSTEQAYVLEFGDQYIRFYKDQGQILSGGSPYEISSPYTEAQLDDIQFTQSADTMYIAHPSHKPRKLTRTGHTSWTLSNYAPTADPFTATDKYPRAVAIYEERLVWAGTNDDPQKIFSTKSADFEDMTVGTAAGDAYTYTIGSDQVNVINWLLPETFLLAGTSGGIFVLRGSGFDDAITPTNVYVRRHTSIAAKQEKPILVQDSPFYIHRLGSKLYGLQYDSTGKYVARDVSLKASGIFTGGKNLSYQDDPYSVLWMVSGDGGLIGVTMELGERMIAWHEHLLGGSDVAVESVTVIPETDKDEVWVAVKRTVDGSTVRYVEYFDVRKEDTHTDFFYLDSGLVYSGSSTTTITGLSHLEGEEVGILADGAWHPNKTVSGGQITLDYAVTNAVVGLPYISRIKSTKLVGGSAQGSSQGKRKKINNVTVHFYKTIGAKVGTVEGELDEIPFRDFDDLMDNPPPLFTGDKRITPPGGWDTDGRIIIEQVLPMPMTVLGYTVTASVVDD